jgi:glycosyltransferase involved in cell wall biosynthesis
MVKTIKKVGRNLRPTVFYTPEGYTTDSAKLMGRHSAGEAFLRAFLSHFSNSDINFLTPNARDSKKAEEVARLKGHKANINCVEYARFEELDTRVLYLPTPGISEYAWRRLRVSENSYSICGVTHTTASHRVMEEVANLLTSPARSWDALICTSTAVRDSINEILTPQADFLKWKLGATRFELPQLPIIPLGVHSKDFTFTENQKYDARLSLSIDKNEIVLLFAGRLSFHAKAHPHPMLEGAQILAENLKEGGTKVTLVQCGWYANENIESAFEEYARLIAPNVTLKTVDGRIPAERKTAWAAADIFVSLSDNIQETFGLTPIEAMAAGVPSVVSDWNGYKDTIEHGVTGFRARTVMPIPGDGTEFATRYDLGVDSYDIYCGYTCELISVDVNEVGAYLTRLAKDKDLRFRMGQAAKNRVADIYEWSQVIKCYEDLWLDLDSRRLFETNTFGSLPIKQPPHRPDPFTLYQCYPSDSLHSELRLINRRSVNQEEFAKIINSGVHSFAKNLLPSFEHYKQILYLFKKTDTISVAALIEQTQIGSDLRTRQVLAWLLKVGLLGLQEIT